MIKKVVQYVRNHPVFLVIFMFLLGIALCSLLPPIVIMLAPSFCLLVFLIDAVIKYFKWKKKN